MTSTTHDWEGLRADFTDPADMGLLPRAKFKKEDPKGECRGEANARGDGRTCGKYHVLPAVHLDYVGHAAITGRLNAFDPAWELAYPQDAAGNPIPVEGGGGELELWATLTIWGITRPAIGTVPKNRTDRGKILIGDCLRNGAMRHGIALDLWKKGQEEDDSNEAKAAPKAETPKATHPPYPVTIEGLEEPFDFGAYVAAAGGVLLPAVKSFAMTNWDTAEEAKAAYEDAYAEVAGDLPPEEVSSEMLRGVVSILYRAWKAKIGEPLPMTAEETADLQAEAETA